MIYALKLLFAVLIVCGAAVMVYRATFRGLLSEHDYRRAWTLVIACMLAAEWCNPRTSDMA